MPDSALPPAPAAPRPDLNDPLVLAGERAVGADFYRGARRGPRAVTALGIVLVVVALSGAAFAPAIRVWDARHRSHEFSFMATIDRRPVRWNPCQPIHYVVNPGAAPPGSLQDVQEAVLTISADTGISFVDDGLTDEVPSRTRAPYQPDRYGERWAPVLIGWVDPRTSSFDFEPGGREAAGIAGPLTPTDGPDDIYVSGTVAINAADPNPPGFAEPGDQGPVVLHELAHVLGLGHYKAQGELMDPSGGGMTDFGPGDLEGLRELGRSAGCLTTPPVPGG